VTNGRTRGSPNLLEDAFHRTQRTSINLMWNPVPFVDIVVEYLAGTRVNKNGQRASSSQIQSGWTLKFCQAAVKS
jgi:hypothetical protein